MCESAFKICVLMQPEVQNARACIPRRLKAGSRPQGFEASAEKTTKETVNARNFCGMACEVGDEFTPSLPRPSPLKADQDIGVG